MESAFVIQLTQGSKEIMAAAISCIIVESTAATKVCYGTKASVQLGDKLHQCMVLTEALPTTELASSVASTISKVCRTSSNAGQPTRQVPLPQQCRRCQVLDAEVKQLRTELDECHREMRRELSVLEEISRHNLLGKVDDIWNAVRSGSSAQATISGAIDLQRSPLDGNRNDAVNEAVCTTEANTIALSDHLPAIRIQCSLLTAATAKVVGMPVAKALDALTRSLLDALVPVEERQTKSLLPVCGNPGRSPRLEDVIADRAYDPRATAIAAFVIKQLDGVTLADGFRAVRKVLRYDRKARSRTIRLQAVSAIPTSSASAAAASSASAAAASSASAAAASSASAAASSMAQANYCESTKPKHPRLLHTQMGNISPTPTNDSFT
uniref:BEN domain-containing protein n=3 Tax=Macrostomum lignano TaxID=282301 RepID=A0A1I8G6W9_9PLAT